MTWPPGYFCAISRGLLRLVNSTNTFQCFPSCRARNSHGVWLVHCALVYRFAAAIAEDSSVIWVDSAAKATPIANGTTLATAHMHFMRRLTTELSGRPRCRLPHAEPANNLLAARVRPTIVHGPLQRVVRLHGPHRRLLSRSAMRVCQPGPVAFHRSMTSTGSRIEMSLRGFAERGRPPLFTAARDKACAVSFGSSLYS